MQRSKHLGKTITSILLLVALLFPSAVQFAHAFENHDHRPCEEISTHLHQDSTECQVCDFQMATFEYKIIAYPEFLIPTIISKAEKLFSSLLLSSFKKTNTQLRAPPYFLV